MLIVFKDGDTAQFSKTEIKEILFHLGCLIIKTQINGSTQWFEYDWSKISVLVPINC